MHRSPFLLRLSLAFVMALGLLGALVLPSFAQDATPTVEPEPTVEPTIEAEGGAEGSLLFLYYLCDGENGDIEFAFTVNEPGTDSPQTPVEDCELATAETDSTFLIYPFGDLNGTPLEITTVNGAIMVTLPITDGTPHLISQKIPELTQEEIDAGVVPIEPITDEFSINEGIVTGVNAIQFRVGTVELHKFRCEGDPSESKFDIANPGDEVDLTAYESCVPDERDFTITPFPNEVDFDLLTATTTDGSVTIENVPTTSIFSGRHHIAEDGAEIEGDFDVEPDKTTIIVAVNYTAPLGSLSVTKIVCIGTGDTEFYIDEDAPQAGDSDCSPAEADFSIYPFSDTNAEPITFSTDSNGEAEIENLPITEDSDSHLLVEDATGAEQAFDIVKDTVTTINVVNFAPPAPGDGTLDIEKLDCAGIAETSVTTGNPGDGAPNTPQNCGSGFASFLIYAFSDESGSPISIDVDGFNSIDLPPTDGSPHLIIEVDGNGNEIASANFEIQSDTTTPIQFLNPTYGRVQIWSYLCDGDQSSYFQVFSPGASATLPSDCTAINRLFYITIFGENSNGSGDTVSVSTVSQNSVVFSGIPATGAFSHTIQPSTGSASGSFDVNEGQTTAIIYYTFASQTTDDTTDDTADSESTTDLADTGVGIASGQDGSMAFLYAILGLGSIIGASSLLRRRSPRA